MFFTYNETVETKEKNIYSTLESKQKRTQYGQTQLYNHRLHYVPLVYVCSIPWSLWGRKTVDVDWGLVSVCFLVDCHIACFTHAHLKRYQGTKLIYVTMNVKNASKGNSCIHKYDITSGWIQKCTALRRRLISIIIILIITIAKSIYNRKSLTPPGSCSFRSTLMW